MFIKTSGQLRHEEGPQKPAAYACPSKKASGLSTSTSLPLRISRNRVAAARVKDRSF